MGSMPLKTDIKESKIINFQKEANNYDEQELFETGFYVDALPLRAAAAARAEPEPGFQLREFHWLAMLHLQQWL